MNLRSQHEPIWARPIPNQKGLNMEQYPMDAFEKYAAAFEVGYATRDWGVVHALMTDDIVWSVGGLPAPIGGATVGRAEAITAIEDSVTRFDRRFDIRHPAVTGGPVTFPDGIHMTFEVTYTREGLAPFVPHGEEWDLFQDGKLAVHHERIHNATEVFRFVALHDAELLPQL